ncbi:MAG: hypothetical protein ABIG11_00760 [bacterium]
MKLIIALLLIGLCGCSGDKLQQHKIQCVSAAEQYYANYLKDRETNPMFSKDVQEITHESAYSTSLDTCVLYVGMKFPDLPGHTGKNLNKFIRDISNNKNLYYMAYGADKSGNEVVLKNASSFATDAEFNQVKDRILGGK